MLPFATPVCDLCKTTARYGKETDMLAEHLSVKLIAHCQSLAFLE